MKLQRYRTLALGLAVVLALASLTIAATASDRDAALKVLFWGDRESHHAPVQRFQDLAPAMIDRGIHMVYSDAWQDLTLDVLQRYDALVVYGNATELPPQHEAGIVDYVESGGGLVAIHSASAMFGNSDAWIRLVGAQFDRHGVGVMTTRIAAPDHPVMDGFHPFQSWDETYIHRRHNDDNRTVLAVSAHTDNSGEPWTWTRVQGDGRVFYTAWGHDFRTFTHPGFHDLIERGIRYAAGQDVPSALASRPIANPFEYESRPIPTYGGQGPSNEMQRPLTPEASMGRMVTPGGFRVELFAAEPLIGKPMDINWDEKGRAWILETADYPNEVSGILGRGNDRLVILEDTDGDGLADKRVVFADGLNIPTSFVFADGGVIVQMAPYTLLLKDTDGDDKADVRQVIMTGWSQGDTHAGASNLTYGLDNHVYGVVGYAGRPGFRQGVWRLPLGARSAADLELIATTDNNTWGFGLSEEGLLFVSTANANPSGYIAIPKRYYDKVENFGQPMTPKIAGNPVMLPNHNRYRQVDQIGRFTAAAGHSLYTARAFPEEYWNSVAFVNEPTGGLIAEFALQRNGTEITSSNPRNLLTSDDEWVSPIVAKVGPDGAVWAVDFYNFIMQHNPTPPGYATGSGNAYETELRDTELARIYRIVWNEADERESLDLSEASPTALVQTLTHDNMLWRMHAQRLLVEQNAWGVVPELIALVQDESVDEIGLNPGAIHALWTLHGIGALDGAHQGALNAAIGALHHPSAGVRRNALLVLPAIDEARDAIVRSGALTDDDAQVRLAALLALSDMPESTEAGKAIFASFQTVPMSDRWLDDAAVIAAVQHAPGFLAAAREAGLDPLGDPTDDAAIYGPNLVQNASFEELDAAGLPVGWGRTTYGGVANHEVVVGGGRTGNAIRIQSQRGADASWSQIVRGLEPGQQYHLSAWIKTQNVAGALGATLHMHELQDAQGTLGGRTREFRGTNDWTYRETIFTAPQTTLTVLALFGGWGQSTGTAIFDDIQLRKVETSERSALRNIMREVVSRRDDVLVEDETEVENEVVVTIENFEYLPGEIRVPVGTTVTWINKDLIPHTVTSGSVRDDPADRLFDSSGMAEGRFDLLFQGDAWSFTFAEPGEYDYYCIPHPSMVGKVIVYGE